MEAAGSAEVSQRKLTGGRQAIKVRLLSESEALLFLKVCRCFAPSILGLAEKTSALLATVAVLYRSLQCTVSSSKKRFQNGKSALSNHNKVITTTLQSAELTASHSLGRHGLVISVIAVH